MAGDAESPHKSGLLIAEIKQCVKVTALQSAGT
jgi:hypothetical protein